MAEFPQIVTEQQLPYSLEAEQAVLGGLLLDPDLITTVLEYVSKPEMFFKKQHRDLFAVLINMFNISKAIDFVTVLDECIKANVFDDDEGAKVYLTQLMQIVPSTTNIVDYCSIVQDKYYIRTLINASNEIIQEASEGNFDAKQILDAAEQRIYNIRQGKDTASLVPIDTVIIQTYDKLQKLTGDDRDQFLGVPTGFTRLDTMITGLNKSDLILLAARPGMGKTSFALNMATNVAKKTQKEVAIFSLEMSNDQLVSRVLSSEAQIKSDKLRTGTLTTEEWIQLAASADILSKTHVFLDDTAGITVAEMKAKLRRLKNLGLVVIDYLQLMSSGRKSENRVQEISQLTRNLKIMAKELNIPIVLLSQLSRASEQRQGHKPMLSDLRDSGSIEQDADIVLFLYREGYYEKEEDNQNVAQCLVAKNRHGSTGEVDLRWIGEFTRFENLEIYRDEPNY